MRVVQGGHTGLCREMRSKTADDKDNQVNHGRSTPFTRFAKKSPKGRCPKGSFRTAEKAMKYETGKQMSMKSRTRNMYCAWNHERCDRISQGKEQSPLRCRYTQFAFFVHITFCHSLRYTAPVFLTPRMLCHSPLLLYIRCPRCGRTDDSAQSLSHQPILCPKPTTERGRKKAKAISRPSRLTRKYTASPMPAPPPLQPEVLQKVTALQTHPSPDTFH